MKIIFMGTPDFAVPSLKALIEDGNQVCMVVTQPDKPKGRGNKLAMPPVKEFALNHGIEVYQPEKVKNEEFINKLAECKADLIVTAAYGKILSEEALKTTPHGCINVHASLLPKYRGAAPLWWVIINGEEKTGITTMLTDKGMDTGDILEIDEFKIDEDITVGELSNKMSELGAVTLIKTLNKLKEGALTPIKQNDSEASYAALIDKTMAEINWNKTSQEIHDLVRGTNPWPVAYTFFKGNRIKIFRTQLIKDYMTDQEAVPGTILQVSNEGIFAKTADGVILIKEIQMDSSKRMEVKEFIKGHKIEDRIIMGGK